MAKRGPKAGGKIKPLTDRDRFNAEKDSRGTGKGHWEVIGGKRVFVKD